MISHPIRYAPFVNDLTQIGVDPAFRLSIKRFFNVHLNPIYFPTIPNVSPVDLRSGVPSECLAKRNGIIGSSLISLFDPVDVFGVCKKIILFTCQNFWNLDYFREQWEWKPVLENLGKYSWIASKSTSIFKDCYCLCQVVCFTHQMPSSWRNEIVIL